MPGLFCPQSKTLEELWAALRATRKMLFSKKAPSAEFFFIFFIDLFFT